MVRSLLITLTFALAGTGLAVTTPASADTLDVSGSALADGSKPQRGMTMDRVEAKWGQPAARIPAVGEPPISRWEYNGFTVYFEYDRVIHTVVARG